VPNWQSSKKGINEISKIPGLTSIALIVEMVP
jgi:hypothetical protein